MLFRSARLGKAFVVYQGHHGDRGAHRADVILPGAAYTEKNATYVNTEGRAQRARIANFPPGEAREDWKILRALSERVGHKLPYDTIAQLRQRMARASEALARVDELVPAAWGAFGAEGPVDATPFSSPVAEFHMTCAISRVSETMASCVAARQAALDPRTGTDG